MRKEREEVHDPNQPALIVTYGNTSRKRRPLDKDVLVLGRMQGCDLPLMSPDVAPVHCVIVRLASGWHIRDCSGHLGTRINGKAVTEEPLNDEDHLQIGPFNFKVYLPPQAEQPTPAVPAATATPQSVPAGQDEQEVEKLKRSRTNLARLALSYRNQAQSATNAQQELKAQLDRQARDNAAERKDLDRDWAQLEKAAQGLRAREVALEQAEKAFQERLAAHAGVEGDQHRQAEEEQQKLRAKLEAELSAQWEKVRREAKLLDEDRADLDRERAALEEEIRQFEARRGLAEAEQEQASAAARAQEEERAAKLAERERDILRRAQELDAFANALLRDRQELQQQAAGPQESAEAEALRSEIRTLTDRVAELERENAALGEPSEQVPTQSFILRIEDEALRRARDEAREQLEKLHLVADALQRENEELRQKLVAQGPSDTVVGLQPGAMVPRAELEATEAAYAAIQMQFKRLQLERDQERSRLREQIEDLRQENELLRQQPVPLTATAATPVLAPSEIEVTDLRSQIDVLRGRLAEIHDEHDAERRVWQQQLEAARTPSADKPMASEEEIRKIVEQIDLLHQENEELRREALERQGQAVETSSTARAVTMLEHQLEALQSDLLLVRGQLQDRDQELEEMREQMASAGDVQTIQTLRQAIQRLQADLKDRDAVIEKMAVELDAPASPASLQKSGGYERELHQFRLELERDRRLLNEQLDDLRQRQQEIEDAARETELLLSRERALLARERSELTRLREEIRMDQERLLRLANSNRAGGVPSVATLREALNANNQAEQNGNNGNGRRR